MARVTIKGCRLNFAVQNPLTKPTAAPMIIMMRKTANRGRVGRSGNIFPAYPLAWRSEAAIQAVTPTMRPAERSVPINIIQPAMPRAIGRFAAESEMMLTIEDVDRNLGSYIAMPPIAANKRI